MSNKGVYKCLIRDLTEESSRIDPPGKRKKSEKVYLYLEFLNSKHLIH